jgi:lipoyl-dependent peroxiredoxin
MAERIARATWTGSLTEGKGRMVLGSGAFDGAFSFATRMGDEPGTNPEELLGAALAGCYSMALNATLDKEGIKARSVNSTARVYLGKDDAGFAVRRIDLSASVDVDADEGRVRELAETVKRTCPISKALAAVEMNLTLEIAGERG